MITLQQTVDTVTAEAVQNVGAEGCIKIKTEQHYIQLVRTVKAEQDVSVCVAGNIITNNTVYCLINVWSCFLMILKLHIFSAVTHSRSW